MNKCQVGLNPEAFHPAYLKDTLSLCQTEHYLTWIRLCHIISGAGTSPFIFSTKWIVRPSNPDRRDLARPLSSILLSDRSDEVVSGEVLELIGYDDIDLAMSILSHRDPIGHKVRMGKDHVINLTKRHPAVRCLKRPNVFSERCKTQLQTEGPCSKWVR